MLNYLHKAYSLLFYKLVKAIIKLDEVASKEFNFSMEWVMYRAMFALVLLQINYFFLIDVIIEIITKKNKPYFIEDTTLYSLTIVLLLTLFNYFTLIYKKRWFKYDDEFANYSKIKNRIINIIIPLFYVFSILLYILVVDIWSSLIHSGKIERLTNY